MSTLRDSFTRLHDEKRIKTPIKTPISGSARYQPVVNMIKPAIIAPTEPIASLTTCKKAPRKFKLW